MVSAITSILAFIVAISVLVAVHEYGHYIVGRWCGMKVLRFSIGFGKPLLTRVSGPDQTEYCLSAIPLGGYVKFLGERSGEAVDANPADQGRAFNDRPVWNRILVLLAGPFFNFLFAFLAYWVLFINGVPTMKPAVGQVDAESFAAEAGLEYGDLITRVGDREVADWESTLLSILDEMVAEGRVPLRLTSEDGFTRDTVLEVGEDAARLTEPGMLFEGLGFQPWQPPALIASVEEAGAAGAAGVLPGDRILAIGDESVETFGDLQRIVAENPNTALTITVLRGGDTLRLDAVIGAREVGGEARGFLGVGIGDVVSDYWYMRQFGPVESIGESVARTWNSTLFTVRMLGRMVTGDVSIKNISGPINIAQFAGSSASAGLNSFLNFLALVSISLGVLNLLPIPILDGGQIVYHGIEGLKGSPLSFRAQMIGQQVGIVALLLLMSFAFYNDIARILG